MPETKTLRVIVEVEAAGKYNVTDFRRDVERSLTLGKSIIPMLYWHNTPRLVRSHVVVKEMVCDSHNKGQT